MRNTKRGQTSKESSKVYATALAVHNHKNVYTVMFMEEKTGQTSGNTNKCAKTQI